MEHIQGPDFPTGAMINGRAGIVQAYRTKWAKFMCALKSMLKQTTLAATALLSLKYLTN